MPAAAHGTRGGGARSRGWIALLANILRLPLGRVEQGEAAAAIGAARLGRMAATGESPSTVCLTPRIAETVEPAPAAMARYEERLAEFRARGRMAK